MSANGTPKRKRRRWLTGCLVILVTLVLMVAVAWVFLGLLSERSDDALKAKGYPTTLTELDAWYETPPAGENAAEFFQQAGAIVEQSSFPNLADLPIQGDADLPPIGTPIPDEMRAVIALFIDHEPAAFELIDEGAQYENARYPINIAALPLGGKFPHLSAVRNTVRAQTLCTLYHSGQGDEDVLLNEYAKLIAVARSISEEPLIISRMVQTAMSGIAMDTSERVLNENAFTTSQLAKLDGSLSKLSENDALLRTFVGERCLSTSTMTRTGVVGILGRYFTAEYLSGMDEWIAFAEDGLPDRLEFYRAMQTDPYSIFRPLSAMTAPSIARSVQSWYEGCARIEAARAAIAVQQWRLAGNELPESFDDFPETMRNAWPIDPFSGKPLVYKRLDEGYIVYSIGGDLVDNGGKTLNELKAIAHSPLQGRYAYVSNGIRISGDVVFRILK